MIVERGPAPARRVDRCYDAAVAWVQRRLIQPLSGACRPRPWPAELAARLRALGLDPERLQAGPFSLDAGAVAALIDEIEARPPRRVLEIGCGLSTVVLAALAARHGFSLLSLDNHADSVAALAAMSRGTPAAERLRLRICRLRRLRRPGLGAYAWFAVDLSADGPFDFVFVDAPIAWLVGRQGVLPEIRPHLAAEHRVLLDDAQRGHERRCLARWSACLPAVLHQEAVPGCARLLRLRLQAA
ncbi:MAG: hypothetical protein KatS3mg121_0620 [Gammaproteobacteria bacterium]|nr:MAG: hypothetical protein KatS3mg121_0620 [Gammaproteobacteria bacterium]